MVDPYLTFDLVDREVRVGLEKKNLADKFGKVSTGYNRHAIYCTFLRFPLFTYPLLHQFGVKYELERFCRGHILHFDGILNDFVLQVSEIHLLSLMLTRADV